jgi:hypothetical protein
MTVKASRAGGNDRATFQHTTQTLEVGSRPVGKIAQCPLTDPYRLRGSSRAAGSRAVGSVPEQL